MARVAEPLQDEPVWPATAGRRPVFLLDAASGFEARILAGWIARHRPPELGREGCDAIRIAVSGRRRRDATAALEASLAAEGDALLVPLRVAWLPRRRGAERAVRPSDLLFGDPRDPGPLRQRWILRTQADRCRVVAGEPAHVSSLRERWRRAGGAESAGLAPFVARQAVLTLERAERALRGARYKVPRLVHEDILGSPAFRGGVARLARELERPAAAVAQEAARCLREIAATHSPFVIDVVAQLTRLLYTRGYEARLCYDRAELANAKALAEQHPVVFLPSHKSNLDHLVLQYALHENGHPPNHTAGGINMNFFPVGPLVRRSGIFFIRRSFRGDPVYRFVFQHYVDYLIEKRFSLEWYIEGGRSRSGKLMPPRFGLLAYVADAYRRGKAEDVILIPVSIAYEQIVDVGDYADEQRGAPKQRESFGWLVRVVRRLRRRYGAIHFRFGEPLALSKALGPPDPEAEPNAEERGLAVQKLAFEVAVRINRVTPITPTSLVTLALLGRGDRAMTLDETCAALGRLLAFAERRDLPTTDTLDLARPEGVRAALEALVSNGVVSCFTEGSEAVYRIGSDQQLAAAYYRNTVIHFFVSAAIAELALLRAAEPEVAEPLAEFWSEAMRLRDLLKFEFFFSEKETFRGELLRELRLADPSWEARLRAGGAEIPALLRGFQPLSAHRVLRPFLEAYRIAADRLAQLAPEQEIEAPAFVSECMGLGKQYLLQRRVQSAASVSQVLMRTALKLADNRGLVAPGGPDLAAGRRALAEQIRAALRRIDAIEALAATRRAGLL